MRGLEVVTLGDKRRQPDRCTQYSCTLQGHSMAPAPLTDQEPQHLPRAPQLESGWRGLAPGLLGLSALWNAQGSPYPEGLVLWKLGEGD